MLLNPEILYEDADLIVINKPAGVVVNQAETVVESTIQSWMAERLAQAPTAQSDWEALIPSDFENTFGTPEEIFQLRQGMVHRLDKDTSGTLVLAKNPGSLINLLRQFKLRHVKKQYLALVHGKLTPPEATLDLPLGRSSRDRKIFQVRSDGRPAVTKYQVETLYDQLDVSQLYQQVQHQAWHGVPETLREATSTAFAKRFEIYQGFSLVKCWPETGRTHQIRVHLAHIQHPLVGDTTYVGKKRQVLDPIWCPRHFLHAHELSLTQPRTGVTLNAIAQLPGDLQNVLAYLK